MGLENSKVKVHRWERGGVDRVPAFIENWGRGPFFTVGVLLIVASAALVYVTPLGWALAALTALYWFQGLRDMAQSRRTILRNFPVLGHARYLAESIRPELRQYFVESEHEQTPYSRAMRSVIYQRAKGVLDTSPFGTRHDVYTAGYEWLAQSLEPTHPEMETARVLVGEGRCDKPYSASIFNVSAMSYGSLSKNAVLALNEGAKLGGFYHNTGEGGVSPYHREPGGDLGWQIGTGYFGCRTADGQFNPEMFAEAASHPQIKMIEIKLSQGAKPAHGGILPGDKVNAEIANIRGVRIGETVVSPPYHTAFKGPKGLLELVARLRELSGGKPIGFKLCVGHPIEMLAIVKAMLETGIEPDFITVDGSEGGTGAAPVEFSDSVGMPLTDGLTLVHNALIGVGKRADVKIVSAGKIASGFHVVRQLALGADLCNSARGMMFALGCIQALKCNTNKCPVGVATQKPKLVQGLVVPDKARRVASFHDKTVHSVLELVGAAGLATPEDLRRHHLFRRTSVTEVQSLEEIYPTVVEGALLDGTAPEPLQSYYRLASADRFAPSPTPRWTLRPGA